MPADLSRLIASTAALEAANTTAGSLLNLGSLDANMTSLETANAAHGDDQTQSLSNNLANIETSITSAGCTANLQSVIDSLNSQLTAEVARLNAKP